jgi:hypothetical protein
VSTKKKCKVVDEKDSSSQTWFDFVNKIFKERPYVLLPRPLRILEKSFGRGQLFDGEETIDNN